jgi:hypothetical protein
MEEQPNVRAKKSTRKAVSPEQARGIHAASETGTGFAIRQAGLIDSFDPTPQDVIKTPETEAAALASLEKRAQQAREDHATGQSVEPSLMLAFYLVWTNDYQIAGAVYLAYWEMISALNRRIAKEREKLNSRP